MKKHHRAIPPGQRKKAGPRVKAETLLKLKDVSKATGLPLSDISEIAYRAFIADFEKKGE